MYQGIALPMILNTSPVWFGWPYGYLCCYQHGWDYWASETSSPNLLLQQVEVPVKMVTISYLIKSLNPAKGSRSIHVIALSCESTQTINKYVFGPQLPGRLKMAKHDASNITSFCNAGYEMIWLLIFTIQSVPVRLHQM